MNILQGYDNRSILYDVGHHVIRRVLPEYFAEISLLFDMFTRERLFEHGIVSTEINHDDSSLIHAKHTISYPYEWPANMYKDAVLFHLQLFIELDRHSLTLKDALPSNILFRHSEPVFVDFSSLVRREKLQHEEWLCEGSKYEDLRFTVVDRMLVPFMIIPLLAMAKRDYVTAREMLSEHACNCIGRPPCWEDLRLGINIPLLTFAIAKILSKWLGKEFYAYYFGIRNILNNGYRFEYIHLINTLREVVVDLQVTPKGSGYKTYYDDKKENFSFDDQSLWNSKQKSVLSVIKSFNPATVLDIGANTGWFSVMAAKQGASVIATDIDESSIDSLYLQAKESNLPILPLLMSFDDLTKKIYGVSYDDPCYQERNYLNVPLFLPATQRLGSDLVLCLGLIHHLVLGMGKSFEQVLQVLAALTRGILVLEFVAVTDHLVQSEPHFFPDLASWNSENYNRELVVIVAEKYFKKCEILPSSSEGRSLLILTK